MGVTRKTNILLLIMVAVCKQMASAKLYNETYETCCGQEVWKLIPNSQCCGNQQYNRDSHYCYRLRMEVKKIGELGSKCGDVFFVDGDGLICCNETLYLASEYSCCRNVTYKIEPNIKILCCGDKLYNDKLEICCYHPESYYTLPLGSASPGTSECCGDKLYNFINGTCCQGVVHPVQYGTCCGTKLIDLNTETCCKDGTSFPIKGSWQACCAGKLYDKSDNICCNDILITDPKYGDLCCGSERYNSFTHDCCNRTVIDKLESGILCCPYEQPPR